MTARDIAILALSAMIVLGFGGVLTVWIIYPPQTRSDLTLLGFAP